MKNFMKKFGTLFLSLALVLVMVPLAAIFAGCGKKESNPSQLPEESTPAQLTEEVYFYFNDEWDLVTCFYKKGDGYAMLQSVDVIADATIEQTWEAFKDNEHFETEIDNVYTQVLEADGYYYLVADWSEISFKIISETHIELSNEPGVNFLEDYELYIPEVN